jgi:hypothetical protein
LELPRRYIPPNRSITVNGGVAWWRAPNASASGTAPAPFGLGLMSECSCALSLMPTRSRLRAIGSFRQVRCWPEHALAIPPVLQNCGFARWQWTALPHRSRWGLPDCRRRLAFGSPPYDLALDVNAIKTAPSFRSLRSLISPHLPRHKHLTLSNSYTTFRCIF